MKTERNYVAAFGAVRMTNCVRYHNFWVHVTVYEEEEERGGTIQMLGYLFHRDFGNEAYVYFLRTVAAKGYEDGDLTKEEFYNIAEFNNVNMGNILGAIMGY
eukprot:4821743-Heterocapsa_arctica.AAC.1